MHGPHHACDKFIDSIALLNKWHQRGDSTFIVCSTTEMREYQFLEGIDLVLKRHEIGNRFITGVRLASCQMRSDNGWSFIPFIGVVDGLQTYIFFVFKKPYIPQTHQHGHLERDLNTVARRYGYDTHR